MSKPDFSADSPEVLQMLSLVASKSVNFIVVTNPDGVVEWVNDAFVRLTGFTAADLVDQRLDDTLCGPATAQDSRREIAEAFRLGLSITEELQIHRLNRTPFWTSLSLTPIVDDDGRITRWVGIGTDISKRRQAYEMLEKAREAADAANRAKSEFLANMSHEIRTPMNAIIGMTDLALATDLTDDQRNYLTTARQSADALLELLNDILDLSKIEAGKLEIEAVPFDLTALLTSTMNALGVRASMKGQELTWRLPPEVPSHLVGDPNRLRQVILNLVSNAIKFTEVGEVWVAVETQWQSDEEVSLHFSVSDTGIGIPAAKLDKIFEAFTQADSSTTRQFGGTGLGLTICTELLRLMNGKIWVQSQIGRGSTFHFSLRFGIGSEPSPTAGQLDAAALAGQSVLVVDDSAANRQMLEERLISWGMKPSLADGASRAVSLWESAAQSGFPFNLVLLDAHMPEVDGFELARLLRECTHLRPVTVMMLSSSDQQGDIQRCRELDISVYLVKPVSPSLLFDSILTALSPPDASWQAAVSGANPGAANGKTADGKAADQETTCPAPLSILVADDHPANRELAGTILRKRGHQVAFAANGREAVEATARFAFDVVLMDVQMPELDGLHATAAIRQREQETHDHLPIIALTAHAMKGDRERCLAAGMDAYLPKPLRAAELQTLVESLGTLDESNVLPTNRRSERSRDRVPVSRSARTKGAPSAVPVQFDFGPALKRMDNDEELLKSQMQFFLDDSPQLIADVESAIASGKASTVQLVAHRLKGLAATYDATAAADFALQLECKGRDGNLAGAARLAEQLSTQVAALRAAMQDYVAADR